MPADDAPDQPLVREVIDAAALAVPLPGGVDDRQVARAALGQEAPLDGRGQRLRMSGPHEPAHTHGRSVGHASDGLLNRYDFTGHGLSSQVASTYMYIPPLTDSTWPVM